MFVAGQLATEDDTKAALELPDAPPESPAGLPSIYAGSGLSPHHEHNQALTAPADRFDMFETMERTCSAVEQACEHQRGITASVTLELTEGEHADDVRKLIGLVGRGEHSYPSQGVHDVLIEMSSALTDGLFVGADVWLQLPDGRYYPDCIEERDRRTLESASFSRHGQHIGFMQAVEGVAADATRAFLPLNQILYVTDRQNTGPFGRGSKRTMYADYVDLCEAQRQMRGGMRKGTFKTVQVYYDDSELSQGARQAFAKAFKAAGADASAWDKMAGKVRGIMSRVVSHVNGVFALPPGWHAKPYGEVFDPTGLLAIERSRKRRILEVVHAGHMNTGAEGTGGTYNAATELQRVAEVIAATGVWRLLRAYNNQIMPRLYAYNWPDVPRDQQCRVTFSGLNWAALQAMASVIDQVGEHLHLGPEDANRIRPRIGLPKIDESSARFRAAGVRAAATAATGRPRTSAADLANLQRGNR